MKLFTTTLTALVLAGCAANSGSGDHSFRLGLAGGAQTSDAEQMALAAEQLAQSSNFIYAEKLADQALKLEPTNIRAKFWKAAVAPAMELKGFMTRIEPLAHKSARNEREYDRALAQINAFAITKATHDFFFEGAKDITSEDEAQETISRAVLKLDELRKTMKELRGSNLVIYRNIESLSSNELLANQVACTAQEEQGEIKVQGCDPTRAQRVELNDADFQVLQQYVAGYEVLIGLTNSYDYNGLLSVPDGATWQQTVKQLWNDSKFGKLRDSRTLVLLPELAVDAYQAAKEGAALQKEICKHGGDCVAPQFGLASTLRSFATIVHGPTPLTITDGAKPVMVNVRALVEHPTTDARTFAPTKYDSKGHVTELKDNTVGGLFPNGDEFTAHR